jgi:hypothetical protein
MLAMHVQASMSAAFKIGADTDRRRGTVTGGGRRAAATAGGPHAAAAGFTGRVDFGLACSTQW